ncbi:MAG TPA: KEOPS complex subunit Cgi121 [Nitrososphaerales archaeon]|nr:KEOPS complex subunit Cgi121 [Nitrososphaerales archaeon]
MINSVSRDAHEDDKNTMEDDTFGFQMAYQMEGTFDVRSASKKLLEGVIICSPKLIAGQDHIDAILSQAKEYWLRNETLARNKSIDLLMRITCQRQISDALVASGISNADALAIFGLVKTESEIKDAVEIIRSVAKDMKRSDNLLSLDNEKQKFLQKFHKLPRWLSKDQLVVALKEKSVLLVLSK